MFEFLIFTKQGLFPFVNVSFTTVSEVLFCSVTETCGNTWSCCSQEVREWLWRKDTDFSLLFKPIKLQESKWTEDWWAHIVEDWAVQCDTGIVWVLVILALCILLYVGKMEYMTQLFKTTWKVNIRATGTQERQCTRRCGRVDLGAKPLRYNVFLPPSDYVHWNTLPSVYKTHLPPL